MDVLKILRVLEIRSTNTTQTFSDRGGTDGLWSALSGLLIELSIPASGLSIENF